MTPLARLLVLVLVAKSLSLGTAAAHAATVLSYLYEADSIDGQNTQVAYTAAPGEKAHLHVTLRGQRARFFDPTVTIHPSDDCRRIDDHTATCPISHPGDDYDDFVVKLGALADHVTVDAAHVPPSEDDVPPIAVDGGGGNDRLDARGSRSPVGLAGSSGHDVLLGGRGADHLEVGSDDRISGGPGADSFYEGDDTITRGVEVPRCPTGRANRIDGGPGSDTLAFDCATRIHVDLARNGRSGEHDKLRSIENAFAVGDRSVLRGDGAANRLIGSGSGDVLDGRGGDDRLVVQFTIDNDSDGLRSDRMHCGAGTDRVEVEGAPYSEGFDGSVSRAAFPPDCELLASADDATLLRRPVALAANGIHGIALPCTKRKRSATLVAQAGLALERGSLNVRRSVGRLRLRCRHPRSAVLPLSAAGRRAVLRGHPLYLSLAWEDGFKFDPTTLMVLSLRFDAAGRMLG
jgi:hypothetical protein